MKQRTQTLTPIPASQVNDVVPNNVHDKLSRLLHNKNVGLGLIEFTTGLSVEAIREPSSLILSVGKIAQATLKDDFLKQLGEEINHYRKKGKLNDEVFNTPIGKSILADLFNVVDGESFNDEKFKAIKNIFMYAIQSSTEEKQKQTAYYVLKVAGKLDSFDLGVLRACYDYASQTPYPFTSINSMEEWVNLVNQRMGLDLDALIRNSDKKLIDLNLISDHPANTDSLIRIGTSFRLTNLGLKLCKLIDFGVPNET